MLTERITPVATGGSLFKTAVGKSAVFLYFCISLKYIMISGKP